jgi:hypothetical protein
MGAHRSGVIDNFTIFSGDELMERIKVYMRGKESPIASFSTLMSISAE